MEAAKPTILQYFDLHSFALCARKEYFMSIFQNIITYLCPKHVSETETFTFRATPRIAHFVMPIVERLTRDDEVGETYRCIVAFWHRWSAPPLYIYQGTTSLCRIDGPLLRDGQGFVPSGGIVETPGLTASLSAVDAEALDARIKEAIEATIYEWAEEHYPGVAAPTEATLRQQALHLWSGDENA